MSMRSTVAVLGAGKLGGAVAALLSRAEQDVVVWARDPGKREALAKAVRARAATTVQDACKDASFVVFAVPVQALADVARAAGDVARGDQIAMHACRGVVEACRLPHQIIRAETCIKKIGALGGPLYLDDAERGRPLVAVIGTRFDEVTQHIRALTANTRVRVHPTDDIVGVELCGALSNVAQLAAGIAEGASLGETDQGILLLRGLVEAARIGAQLGAERATFSGLAGVGDLIPRAVTSTRRNRHLGKEIGAGQDAMERVAAHPDLEGPHTAREAKLFGERHGLRLPLVEAVHAVLFEGAYPVDALDRVLALDLELAA